MGAVAALLAVVAWIGLAGAVVPPEAAWLAGRPARARPSAVPPAASRKARVSTTGSRAVRRREGRGPVAGACQFWARMVWVGFSYPADFWAAVLVSWASSCGAVGRA